MPNVTTSVKAIVENAEKLLKGNIVTRRLPDSQKSIDRLQSGDLSRLPRKIYLLGEKGSSTRPLGGLQDFDVLKAKNLSEKKKDPKILFEDPEFPADNSSIGSKEYVGEEIEWKRPSQIVGNGVQPQLFVDGPSRFDIKQNHFENCWFLTAASAIAMREDLLYQVVPKDQSFQEDYAGIFHFRFWQHGRWVDVVVDDRLPTQISQVTGQVELYGAYSTASNEFWPALLQKAYAKLHGSYEAIDQGNSGEALEDLTGGISECYYAISPPSFPRDLYSILTDAHEKKSLITCALKKADEGITPETDEHTGLLLPREYTITNVSYVEMTSFSDLEKSVIPLIRLKNSFGDCDEIKRAWSDESLNWEFVSEAEKQRLDFDPKDDGEFWVSYMYFEKIYEDCHICHLDRSGDNKWEISEFDGAWVRGATAGGFYHLENFQHNPQYRITLKEESTFVVSLMQKKRTPFPQIGFSIYPLAENLKKPLDANFFKETQKIDIDSYKDRRTVSYRLTLQSGAYCIVPSTLKDDLEGEFLLRVISDEPIDMEEYDEQSAVDLDNDDVSNESWYKFCKYLIGDYPKRHSSDHRVLDWRGLKKILDSTFSTILPDCEGFNKHVCRSLVDMLDRDESGMIGFYEFTKFWAIVDKLWDAFASSLTYTDDDGYPMYIDTLDLRNTLNRAGYHLNNHILCKFVRRYATDDLKLTFEDLVMCAMELQSRFDESGTFNWRKQNESDNANDTNSV